MSPAFSRRRAELTPLGPLQQLRAGHLPRRIGQLLVGLWLYGLSMAMIVRATLGLDPWDVFHAGVGRHAALSFGTIVILTGVACLLLWIPLRQWPGLGTVLNTVVIGLATDQTLSWLATPVSWWGRVALLVAGIVLNGLAGGLYIGSQLGPGPRDGLMTGIARRSGLSIRLVRTGLEVLVLAVGWLLGGAVGLGTLVFALTIGPLVQFFLPLCTVRLDQERLTPPAADAT